MSHWEYRKINLNDLPRRAEDIDVLTDAGARGWELIAITANNIAYLKRPIEDTVPQEAATPARTARRKTAATTAK
jgi:hypothetical protein